MKKPLFFFALLFLALICVYSLAIMPLSLTQTAADEDVCLQFWHVDSFEGGTGSRRAYLQKLCKSFCSSAQKNDGKRITVAVKQLTPLALSELFKKGVYPDLISFGAGIELPYDRLVEADFGAGEVGVYNGTPYAAVWAQGGYVCIKRKGEGEPVGYIICEQEFANPLLALRLSKTISDGADIITLPAKEGVCELYRRKNYALVGTQRDLYRLDGKLEIDVEPLSGYNDLYCCIAVLHGESAGDLSKSSGFENGGSGEKIKAALALAKYVALSGEARPSDIGFLNYKGESFDKSAPISPLNGYSPKYALSVFTAEGQVKKLKSLSLDYSSNEQIIKNMLKRLK